MRNGILRFAMTELNKTGLLLCRPTPDLFSGFAVGGLHVARDYVTANRIAHVGQAHIVNRVGAQRHGRNSGNAAQSVAKPARLQVQ